MAFWKRDAIADCWNSFRGKKVEEPVVEEAVKEVVEEVGFATACVNKLKKMWTDFCDGFVKADGKDPIFTNIHC